MRILVTGHRGLIGKFFYEHLLREHDCVGIDKDDDIPNLDGVDWVIHLGAISDPSCTDVSLLNKYNVDYSKELIDRCVRSGTNMQFASSASVYGKGQLFVETEHAPVCEYARGKLAVEMYAQQAAQSSNSIFQCFRYFNVCGANEDSKLKPSPAATFIRQIRTTGKVKLFEGSEKYFRDIIHVYDVMLLQRRFFNVRESGVWNIGSGEAIPLLEIAETVCSLFGGTIEYIPMPAELRYQYQAFTKADMRKVHDSLHKWGV
jgi:ADP-L-glycero-D-manno-heptose 6-epimerase